MGKRTEPDDAEVPALSAKRLDDAVPYRRRSPLPAMVKNFIGVWYSVA